MNAPIPPTPAPSAQAPSPFTGEGWGGGSPAGDAAIAVHINGTPRTLPSATTVADLVRDTLTDDAAARAVAVARNGAIVPRAEWPATALVEGDTIEIVRPVQGG